MRPLLLGDDLHYESLRGRLGKVPFRLGIEIALSIYKSQCRDRQSLQLDLVSVSPDSEMFDCDYRAKR